MYEVQDEGPDIMFGWKSSEPVNGKKVFVQKEMPRP